MDTFLEILKYILPALVVFATVYLLIKRFLDQQHSLELMKYRQAQVAEITPLKLQAYERLLMLCERISIPNLMLRLNVKESTVEQLSKAMLVAIQQEYEHNLTQQIYVSESLWQIITMAKNQTSEIVSTAASKLDRSAPGNLIAMEAAEVMQQSKVNPLDAAKRSIRKELSVLFG
jgi:hypothetical protein